VRLKSIDRFPGKLRESRPGSRSVQKYELQAEMAGKLAGNAAPEFPLMKLRIFELEGTDLAGLKCFDRYVPAGDQHPRSGYVLQPAVQFFPSVIQQTFLGAGNPFACSARNHTASYSHGLRQQIAQLQLSYQGRKFQGWAGRPARNRHEIVGIPPPDRNNQDIYFAKCRLLPS
jgi:hypothetical protein